MKNWDDDSILNFLMTSDFDENISPEDLKFLLIKFRYFYRIIAGKSYNLDVERKKFDFEIESLKKFNEEELNILENKYNTISNELNILLNRKLTIKERLLGKITIKKIKK